MATLANVFGRFFPYSGDRAPLRASSVAPRGPASVAVRAFANEDIYFYVKRIDNSRIVRQADPKARGACWKAIAGAGAAAVLLIAVLLPSAYGLMAGYQIENLKAESKRLENERASLELQEATLISPARMEELARAQQFVDPGPQKVVYLDSNNGSSVAMNRK